MVAISGAGWRLAPALVRLMEETDRLFPARVKISDGSIGDSAHSARTSDHNPDGGWVDAVDITDDDAHGCDVGVLAHHLVASRDRRVSYLIHQGTIWRGYDKPGLPAFTPQTYTGPNAHTRHLHVSVVDGQRYSSASWWPQLSPSPPPSKPPTVVPEEEPMVIIRKSDPKNGRLLVAAGKVFAGDEDDIAVNEFTPRCHVGDSAWNAIVKAAGSGLVRV